MEQKMDLEAIAIQYELQIEFVEKLYSNVVDKENFIKAVKMFVNGTLPYEMAVGDNPINVAELRKQVAKNLVNSRSILRERAMEKQREIVEYYSSCTCLKFKYQRFGKTTSSKTIVEIVYIKNSEIVAFAHFENKKGGIYAANNQVMPNFRWNPHDCLARLRKLNKAFYRKVKKAAFNSPNEWFKF